ncbi:MAG: ATP-binding protein [Eubacterium sp.]|nr:ATP-binding protein [Eubacterium sp.]
MPYSNDIYRKAERELERRRERAELIAEERREEIRRKLPEVDKLQRELAGVGLEISRLFFLKEEAPAKLEELKAKSKALVAQRNAVLTQNGYDEDAMKPDFICPHCEDKGFIGGRMCACHKQLLKDIMRREVSRFAPLERCTFDTFDLNYYSDTPLENSVIPRQRAEKISDAAFRYAQGFQRGSKNILFLGSTGLGKTHLSLAIANVVINSGLSVCYGTSQNICDDLRNEMFGRDNGLDYTKDKVLQADLLIIDDLGTEIENQYNTATLYNIINCRILSGRPTVISTNYDFDELLDKYDQRITSRLNGEYVKMTLVGTDIRNK